MARLILTTRGEDARIGGNIDVIGTSAGGEIITVIDGDINFDASFNNGGDTIVLSGAAASYSIQLSGSRAVLTDGQNQMSIPLGTAGLVVQFADASHELKIDPESGTPLLGAQIVTSTPEQVSGNISAAVLNLDAETFVGYENDLISGYSEVVLGSARGEDGADGHRYEFFLENDNAPSSGSVLKIDGSALAADTDGPGPLISETVFLDAARVDTFALDVSAGGGDDFLGGSARDDLLKAGAGDDTVIGGLGADFLVGGAGADWFAYYSEFDSSVSQGRDTIQDFQPGTDQLIAVSFAIFEFAGNFGSFSSANSSLIAGDYIVDLVFQQDENIVWADLDDDGVLDSTDFSAVLEGVSSLTQDDFAIFSPAETNFVAESEGNDTIGTAQNIDGAPFNVATNANLYDTTLPSLEIRGTISSNNDIDIFSIYLEAGETLIMDVDDVYDPDVESYLDSYIAVTDELGNVLAENDDAPLMDQGSSWGYDSFLQFTAPADGEYFFGIGSYDYGAPGGVPEIYHLLVSVEPPPGGTF